MIEQQDTSIEPVDNKNEDVTEEQQSNDKQDSFSSLIFPVMNEILDYLKKNKENNAIKIVLYVSKKCMTNEDFIELEEKYYPV